MPPSWQRRKLNEVFSTALRKTQKSPEKPGFCASSQIVRSEAGACADEEHRGIVAGLDLAHHAPGLVELELAADAGAESAVVEIAIGVVAFDPALEAVGQHVA